MALSGYMEIDGNRRLGHLWEPQEFCLVDPELAALLSAMKTIFR
jgi:hypothetical protein